MAVTFEEVSARWCGSPPIAVELAIAARLLEVDPRRVELAAATLAPYVHRDGSLRWSLAQLADALGLARRNNKGQVAHARMPAGGITPERRRDRWRRSVDLPDLAELAGVGDLGAVEVEDLAELAGEQ